MSCFEVPIYECDMTCNCEVLMLRLASGFKGEMRCGNLTFSAISLGSARRVGKEAHRATAILLPHNSPVRHKLAHLPKVESVFS